MKTSAMPGAQAATSAHTNSLWEHQSFGDKRVSGWDGVAIAQAAGCYSVAAPDSVQARMPPSKWQTLSKPNSLNSASDRPLRPPDRQ